MQTVQTLTLNGLGKNIFIIFSIQIIDFNMISNTILSSYTKNKKMLLWGPSWLYPKQQYQSPYLFHQCWSDLSHCLIRVKFAVKLSWMVSDQNQYFVNSTLTVLINRENVNHGATWWHLCHILPLILCTGLQKKLWTKVTGKL